MTKKFFMREKSGPIQWLALAAALLFCLAAAIVRLAVFWEHSYVYSYGFLIPLISAYLVWRKRKTILRIMPSPSYAIGGPLFLAGLILLVIGNKGSIFTVQSLSIVFVIAGVVLLLFGGRFFWALLFPIGYLMFMIPVWGVITDRLRMPFRFMTAFMASNLIRMTGAPVYWNSVFIWLPNITLQVAPQCSGIDNLIAVLALALPLAYLTLKSWPRRILLVAGGIAIAAFSNGVRVALIGFLSYEGITATLHGPGHVLAAMFVSFVGFLALFAGAWALSDKKAGPAAPPGEDGPSGHGLAPPPGEDGPSGHGLAPPPLRLLIPVICVLAATGAYINFFHTKPVRLAAGFKSFPYEIGTFKGYDEGAAAGGIITGLNADEELSRIYRNASGDRVRLYIAYLGSQGQYVKLFNYRTAWLFEGSSIVKVRPAGSQTVEVMRRIVSPGNGGGRAVYFWYDLGGRMAARKWSVIAGNLLNTVVRGRDNGAFIMVSADARGKDRAPAYMDAFTKDLLPVVGDFIR